MEYVYRAFGTAENRTGLLLGNQRRSSEDLSFGGFSEQVSNLGKDLLACLMSLALEFYAMTEQDQSTHDANYSLCSLGIP